MLLVEKPKPRARDLRKIEEHNHRIAVRLPLAQKKERVKRELKERHTLNESVRERAKARKRGRERQKRVLGEMMQRRRYELCVQECFYGLLRVVCDRVLEYARLAKVDVCSV